VLESGFSKKGVAGRSQSNYPRFYYWAFDRVRLELRWKC
jgi:hypothetical protein